MIAHACTVDIVCFDINNGILLGNPAEQSLPSRTIAIHLEGPKHDTERFRGVQQDGKSIQGALQQMVSGDVIDIREGSVEIWFCTTNPDQIIPFLNCSDERKTIHFLRNLSESSISLVNYFGNEFTVKFWAEEAVLTKDKRIFWLC